MMEPLVIHKSEYTSPSNKPLTPVYTKYPRYCYGIGYAACNSKLYMFGGNLDCSDVSSDSQDVVFYYDTSNPTIWQKFPRSMHATRQSPVAITIKDSVYIFGAISHLSGLCNPWAEVFNTKSGRLERLRNQPPKESLCNRHISCSAVMEMDEETKILLLTAWSRSGDKGKLLFYSVDNGHWEDVSESHVKFFTQAPVSSTSRRSAVMNGVLYTFYRKKVYAYDLENREWFKQPVLGLLEEESYYFDEVENIITGFVLNIGNGKLCVGSCSTFPGPGPTDEAPPVPKILIYYAVFTPYFESEMHDKRARSSGSVTPLVHSKGYHVVDALHFVDAMAM